MTVHVFDAYGTLLDVHAPLRHLAEAIGPRAEEVNRLLRTKQLEYTWVRTLGGFPWRDFRQLTADALDYALAAHGIEPAPGLKKRFVDLYDALDSFPDAVPALTRLKASGARLAILSNGTRAMLAGACRTAGLAPLLDAVISVDDVARFKTAPDVYAACAARLEVGPDSVAFYSSNRWDVAAATHFGFATTWVNRAGAPDEYRDLPPGRVVRNLADL
jgi:2-haloacid dehalogenase